MNPIVHALADEVTIGTAGGFITALFLLVFGGWSWWALRPANRERFERDSLLPLMDDDVPGGL